jgi:hypothetical protein
MRRGWLPLLSLAFYGAAFGWKALSGGLLVFDDHPGQLYRLSHAIVVGLAPWRLNLGWWAGYAELQFYPPGFSYAGAALHYASLGMLDASAAYRVLLWVALLLPALSTYALLLRILKDPWLALPGAFLAFTLSADSRSGVEQGMRWGLVASRLGWSLLPLLALTLHRSAERRVFPILAPVLLAAIILIHPAHAPAGVALVLLAIWHAPSPRASSYRRHMALLLAAAGLCAFWLLPLVAHLGMALPLAWGDPTLPRLARSIANHPLLLALIAASALSWWAGRRTLSFQAHRWISYWAPAMAGVIILDAAIAQPLGVLWLPADRVLDSFLLALIVSASLGLPIFRQRVPMPTAAIAVVSIALAVALSAGRERALTLWPRGWPNEWPKYETVARDVKFAELRHALSAAPAGRVLFIESAVPLDERGSDWRRPHTHLASLIPLNGGRDILNGTFTHSSPVAGLVYTGSAANRPVTSLVEQRDGRTLFGRPLSDLEPGTFDALAERLRVSVVIALDGDRGRVDFVAANPAFTGPVSLGPFLLFTSREPRPLPAPDGDQRWRVTLSAPQGGWTSTGMAYSPLWHGLARGQPVPLRESDIGLLEVRIPPGDMVEVELEHRPGPAEWIGLALSVASLVSLAVAGYRRRRSHT